MTHNLHTPLRETPLAFVDTETTGLRPELGHRLVEVAVLRTNGLEKVSEFSSLLNPQRAIDPGAAAVNGITANMVANAPTFAEILPQLKEVLAGAVIVAHNAPFDMGFLEMEYRVAGEEFQPGTILDTLMLARRQYHFYSNSLGNIAKTLGFATPDAHRAMGDVLTTYAVFRRFSGDLIRRNRPLVSDWLRMQGGTVWTPPAQALAALGENHPLHIALTQGKKLAIEYRSVAGSISQRVIEPRVLSGQYLVAYCHLRHDQRTFRVDNILSMKVLNS